MSGPLGTLTTGGGVFGGVMMVVGGVAGGLMMIDGGETGGLRSEGYGVPGVRGVLGGL